MPLQPPYIQPSHHRPPIQPTTFQPPLPPNAAAQAAILHHWASLQGFIKQSVYCAFQEYGCGQGPSAFASRNGYPPMKPGDGIPSSHVSNSPAGVSRTEAEALFSTFCGNVRKSIHAQLSEFLQAQEEHKKSSNAEATSYTITAQNLEQLTRSTEGLRQDVQNLLGTLRSEVNLQAQKEVLKLCESLSDLEKLTGTTMASWDTTAANLERTAHSIESFTKDFRTLIAQTHAKPASEMSDPSVEELSTMIPRPAALGLGDKDLPILREIKDLMCEIRSDQKALLEGAASSKSKRIVSSHSAANPRPITRAQKRAQIEAEARAQKRAKTKGQKPSKRKGRQANR
ncbi:hypothetical protein ACHAO7_010948 [Fusarium culmorum]